MPQPTTRDLHVDQLLTEIATGFKNRKYIADEMFPIVPVQKQSDLLLEYDKSPWFRDDAKLRVAGTKSVGGGFTVSTDENYFCKRYSRRVEIDDEQRDNADEPPFELDKRASEFGTDKLFLRRERNFASTFMTTGVWDTDKVGGVDFIKWSDYATSSPLVDLTEWVELVDLLINMDPNLLAMGRQVWSKLKWHPDIIDTIKYTQTAMVSLELFAALVEIEKVLVGKATYTDDPEGTPEASVTYNRVWGKDCLLLYRPDSPSLFEPSAGYTFVWRRVPNALQYVKRMRDEEREVDIFEANSYFDQKQTAASAGLFGDEVIN
jgi:hypothetical protein